MPSASDRENVRHAAVSDGPTGRTFTNEYKAQILQRVEHMRPGDVDALLRQEGLDTAHLTEWRAQRDRAVEQGLEPQRPGPRPQPARNLARRVAQLERETAKLEKKLKQAEAVIAFQKRLSETLGIPLDPVPTDDPDETDGRD